MRRTEIPARDESSMKKVSSWRGPTVARRSNAERESGWNNDFAVESTSAGNNNVFVQSYADPSGNPVAEKISIKPTYTDRRQDSSFHRHSHASSASREPSHLAAQYKMIESAEDDPFYRGPPVHSGRRDRPLEPTGDGEYSSLGEPQMRQAAGTGGSLPGSVAPVGCLSGSLSCSIPNGLHDPWYPQRRVYCDTSLAGDINSRCSRVSVSDRPVLCMSLHPSTKAEVVVGSSDHACYSIDPTVSSLRAKQMYNKRSGHSEWVTSVAHLPNNSVLSVGMDNKVCLWGSNRSTCVAEYTSVHFGSISKVLTDANPGMGENIAFTSGYDGKVNVWAFPASSGASSSGRQSQYRMSSSIRKPSGSSNTAPVVATCSDSGCGPIIEMMFNQGHVIAGTREGGILFYDIGGGTNPSSGEISPHRRLKAHKKSVTQLCRLNDSSPCCFVSGSADSLIRVWDCRLERCCVQTIAAHPSNNPNASLTPAITALTTSGSADPNTSFLDDCYILSGGSDNLINVTDIRRSGSGSAASEIVSTWDYHKNGVYSMCIAARGVIFSGDGAGMLHCYDIYGSRSQEPGLRYGIGVCEVGAIQAIGVLNGVSKGPCRNKVVCTGDDGFVNIYDF